jgi:hypothetical protein
MRHMMDEVVLERVSLQVFRGLPCNFPYPNTIASNCKILRETVRFRLRHTDTTILHVV